MKEGFPNEGSDYGLILPFIDQSPEFALGVETGIQYARMLHGIETEWTQTVHTENLGQLRAAAMSIDGWTVRFEPIDEHFSIMYTKRGTQPGE